LKPLPDDEADFRLSPITSLMETPMLLSDPSDHTRMGRLLASAANPDKVVGLTDLLLCQLLNPDLMGDSRALYHRIRSAVRWDVLLRAWVVTRYEDVVWVLRNLSATGAPSQERRMRRLLVSAFTADKVAGLTDLIRQIARKLLINARQRGEMDVITEFADPFPGRVIAVMLGVPEEDHRQLAIWATDFAETFGNFYARIGPDTRDPAIVRGYMASYFRNCISRLRHTPNEGPSARLRVLRLDFRA
jgi:cytochrome P450